MPQELGKKRFSLTEWAAVSNVKSSHKERSHHKKGKMIFSIFILTWGHFFYCFERDRNREREEREKRGRETSVDCLLIWAPTRDQIHNLGMCLDWESNPQLSSLQDDAPTNWATPVRVENIRGFLFCFVLFTTSGENNFSDPSLISSYSLTCGTRFSFFV